MPTTPILPVLPRIDKSARRSISYVESMVEGKTRVTRRMGGGRIEEKQKGTESGSLDAVAIT